MSRHRALQSGSASAQQSDRHTDIPAELSQRVYLTSREAVAYLGLPSVDALQQRVRRGTIPAWCWTRMGGKSLRFLRASLDEWLQPQERTAALRVIHGRTVATPSTTRKGNSLPATGVAR